MKVITSVLSGRVHLGSSQPTQPFIRSTCDGACGILGDPVNMSSQQNCKDYQQKRGGTQKLGPKVRLGGDGQDGGCKEKEVKQKMTRLLIPQGPGLLRSKSHEGSFILGPKLPKLLQLKWWGILKVECLKLQFQIP